MSRPDADQWKEAMNAEIKSLLNAGTYEIVSLPPDCHAIGGKWVFTIKCGPNGEIIKYKARWVAQGFSQRYGIDYEETFAPVARFDSIRLILAQVAWFDWELHQMDVKSAYLNGTLEEEIYMRQPKGFAAPGAENKVCRLKKSLYGLKQAGRTWNKRIDSVLRSLHFVPIHADPCVYVYKRDSVIIIISLYVDDLLLASPSLEQLTRVKAELSSSFDMEDLGEARFVLGIEITRDRLAGTLTISQGAYTEDVLQRFGMMDCNSISTPMEVGRHLEESAAVPLNPARAKSYQSAVGALMYAAHGTRPDISFAVTTLSKFNSKPTLDHWQALKRVLRYLRGTIHYGITYHKADSPDTQPTLLGYCDSDYAEDRSDRRSITGYAFLLGGAAISWCSRKQATVSTSTTEAEYMAVSEAAKEAMWWRYFFTDLGYDMTKATRILSDNQGSIKLSKNPENHRRTKHIDIRHHYIRERVEEGSLELIYVRTSQMAADVLTKPLGRLQHSTTIGLLGMHTPSSSSSSSPTA